MSDLAALRRDAVYAKDGRHSWPERLAARERLDDPDTMLDPRKERSREP